MLTIFTPLIEWIPGADHSNTFRPQDKQAMSSLAAGRTAKAIRLYKRTLADCEQTLGADHPYTFRSRNNLAMGYRAAGRTAKAIPLLERTLADCERVLRAVHPDTLTSRHNLAMSYWAAGRPVEAILLLERTLADCERVLGADHPKTKAARKDLATLTGEPQSLDCAVRRAHAVSCNLRQWGSRRGGRPRRGAMRPSATFMVVPSRGKLSVPLAPVLAPGGDHRACCVINVVGRARLARDGVPGLAGG